MYYTIEHYGSKGWEVSKETNSPSEAQREFLTIITDGYNARITGEHPEAVKQMRARGE